MPTLTHTQARTVTADGAYQVVDTVTAASGIQAQVFVYRTDTAAYEHVATAIDMTLLPNSRATAQTGGIAGYRDHTVAQEWSTLDDAAQFAADLPLRLKALLVDYAALVATFVGTDSGIVISS